MAEPQPIMQKRPLGVEVYEGTTAVQLRIRVPVDVDPGSVEILLAGSNVTIYARDVRTGRRAYERRLTLHGPVNETGVTAESEGSQWLRVVLPRPSVPPPVSRAR